MSDDQQDRVAVDLRMILPMLYAEQEDARAFLEEIGRERRLQPDWPRASPTAATALGSQRAGRARWAAIG
ncbi:MAG TPA: hypothetical protein VMV92_24080 [Streptosporangiaceae bacterium]|nr:hypothetical protein [Streptosporangiaceae bacterium]